MMMLMTDDADIVAQIPEANAAHGVDVRHVPPGRPLASTSAVAADERLAATDCEKYAYKPQCQRNGFNYRRDPTTGALVGSEEMYQFLLTWHLVAHCDLMVGMGLRSYFSDLLFTMMCAIYGSCPARVDIHRPNVLEDDGNWHYADRRTDPRLAAAAWRALRLPEGLFTNS